MDITITKSMCKTKYPLTHTQNFAKSLIFLVQNNTFFKLSKYVVV